MQREKDRNKSDVNENVPVNILSEEYDNSFLFTHVNYNHNYASM